MKIDDLEAIARATTPGPRHAERFFREGDTPETPGRYRIFLLGHANPRTNSRDCDWTFDDAHFIAAFDRETVLKLIALAKAALAWRNGDGFICLDHQGCGEKCKACGLFDAIDALQERPL